MKNKDTTMRELWIRLGVTVKLTKTEAAQVLDGNNTVENVAKVVKRAFLEGRVRPDGDTYVPEEAIEDFNEKYHTEYPTEETDCDLYITDEEVEAQKRKDFIDFYISLHQSHHFNDSDIIKMLEDLFTEKELEQAGFGEFIHQPDKEDD